MTKFFALALVMAATLATSTASAPSQPTDEAAPIVLAGIVMSE